MPKAKRIYTADFPYHIRARCTNREWFRLDLESVWEIFEDYLFSAHRFYGLQIHSFVLMSNHFHLMASTPNANIDECMRHLMLEVSREITRRSGRINQTFGGPYRATVIDNPHYFSHCYKYVYRNPVEAGLENRVEKYPFSTLPALLGQRRLHIPLIEDGLLFENPKAVLDWLNESYRENDRETIEKALRRKTFEIPRDRVTRSPHRLETERS